MRVDYPDPGHRLRASRSTSAERVRSLRRTYLVAHLTQRVAADRRGADVALRRMPDRNAIARCASTWNRSTRRCSFCPERRGRCASSPTARRCSVRCPTSIRAPKGSSNTRASIARHSLRGVFGRPNSRPAPDADRRARSLPRPTAEYHLANRRTRARVGGDVRDPLAMAKAIESRLRKDYRYTSILRPEPPKTRSITSFRVPPRHCEFYSTAMAVMLRTLGVPTRTSPLHRGTYNRFGRFYAVRQGDAHSWIEIYIDGRGWDTLRSDATRRFRAAERGHGILAFCARHRRSAAQRWNRNVVNFNLKQQLHLFARSTASTRSCATEAAWWATVGSPRRLLLLLSGLSLIVAAAVCSDVCSAATGSQMRRERPAAGCVAGRRALQVARSGAFRSRRPSSRPARPVSSRRVARRHGPPVGAEALELTKLYLEIRFWRAPALRKRSSGLRTPCARAPASTARASACRLKRFGSGPN